MKEPESNLTEAKRRQRTDLTSSLQRYNQANATKSSYLKSKLHSVAKNTESGLKGVLCRILRRGGGPTPPPVSCCRLWQPFSGRRSPSFRLPLKQLPAPSPAS